MHAGTKGLLAPHGSFNGVLELTNALQGIPQQVENVINIGVWARCAILGKAARLMHSLAKLGLLLTHSCPLLAGPLAHQKVYKSRPWGQDLIKLGTQGSVLDL